MSEVAPSPSESSDPLSQAARREALLRSAAVLLVRGASLEAVRILHCEIQSALGEKPAVHGYRSLHEAREVHRRLITEGARSRRVGRVGRSIWPFLRRCAPVWASWAAVAIVSSFLVLRYVYALWDKARWARENPGGNWISRYYPKLNYDGSPLIRYDVAIDYDWGMAAPAESMARDNWSATWDTCMRVLADVALPLKLTADEKARLLVDDEVRLNVPRPGSKKDIVKIVPGMHHIRIEYQERRRGAELRLKGIDYEGTEYYTFQRPQLEGDNVYCEGARK